MTEENWVKLPEPAPKTLPVGTRLLTRHGFRWELKEPHMLSSEWGLRSRRAYLGDHIDLCTGADLSGALCEASDIESVLLPPGYRFEGSEVVKEETVAIPASLAGAVGLEKYANEAYAQAIQDQWIQAKPSDGLGDNGYVFRQGDYQNQAQIRLVACPECAFAWDPLRQNCEGCGATAKSIKAKRAKPACKCGATENTRLEWCVFGKTYQCGPCYQSRRRTELQAQKLEQTKRDMSRPVKRDPYEWLGFSSADWEE